MLKFSTVFILFLVGKTYAQVIGGGEPGTCGHEIDISPTNVKASFNIADVDSGRLAYVAIDKVTLDQALVVRNIDGSEHVVDFLPNQIATGLTYSEVKLRDRFIVFRLAVPFGTTQTQFVVYDSFDGVFGNNPGETPQILISGNFQHTDSFDVVTDGSMYHIVINKTSTGSIDFCSSPKQTQVVWSCSSYSSSIGRIALTSQVNEPTVVGGAVPFLTSFNPTSGSSSWFQPPDPNNDAVYDGNGLAFAYLYRSPFPLPSMIRYSPFIQPAQAYEVNDANNVHNVTVSRTLPLGLSQYPVLWQEPPSSSSGLYSLYIQKPRPLGSQPDYDPILVSDSTVPSVPFPYSLGLTLHRTSGFIEGNDVYYNRVFFQPDAVFSAVSRFYRRECLF